MYRERLKSRNGCLRCKSRRTKCDELTPKCSFCARWNVECVRPLDGVHNSDRAPANRQQNLTALEERQSDRNSHSIILRPSLEPPISTPSFCAGSSVFGSVTHADVLRHVSSFVTSSLDNALPFNVTAVLGRLRKAMLDIVLADEAVYCSLAAHILGLPRKDAPGSITTELAQRFERKTLTLLRHRIESGMPVTDGTLAAAAIHGAGAASRVRDKSCLSKIAGGIRALTQALAAEKTIDLELNSIILISLLFFDRYNSFLAVEKPLFGWTLYMPQPASLNRVSTSQSQDGRLAECLHPDIMSLLKDLRLLFSFRDVTRSFQSLSSNEALYVCYLCGVVDHGLLTLQALYADTQSLAEIAVLGMSLLKLEILPTETAWSILGNVIRQRLIAAISACQTLAGTRMTVVLWSCTVALLGKSSSATKSHFLSLVSEFLTCQNKTEKWPATWGQDLGRQLQLILWHESFDIRFNRVCLELRKWQRRRSTPIETQG